MKIEIKSNIQDYVARFVPDHRAPLLQDCLDSNNFFLIDRNVYDLYDYKEFPFQKGQYCLLDAIETNKTLDMAQEVILQLVAAGIKRTHTLIAVGGGITQDLVCFIASILYRGIKWKYYPTTLLAQADSCIGSKSSINLKNGKNQVGTFYPPIEIIIDVNYLNTLENRELLSGMGEIIKVHLLDPRKRSQILFDNYEGWLQSPPQLKKLIYNSLLIKKDVIEQDEYDTDLRNIMNYGHTFGHAIESASDYAIPHGIAVTIGMGIANHLSLKLGYLEAETFEQMQRTIKDNSASFKFNIAGVEEQYWVALHKDKKNVDEKIMCILTEGFGKMKKTKVDLDLTIKNYIIDYLRMR